jgi:alpha 1,3-mannosyltransferase
MFTPRHAPLKEGRSQPGLPYAGPPRRSLRSRQGAIAIVLLLCVPLVYLLSSGGPASSISPQVVSPGDMVKDPPGGSAPLFHSPPNEHATQPHDQQQHISDTQSNAKADAKFDPPVDDSKSRSGSSDQDSAPPPQKPKSPPRYDAEDEEESAPSRSNDVPGGPKMYSSNGKGSGLSGAPKEVSNPSTFSERPRFEKSLARVIGLLPGEMEGRDLLRPVEGTGKEKLREMGLRVREYKKFFDAWEELHLTFDEEGGSYVRDDVIQYLRHHQHQPTGDEFGESPLAQTIHSYEAYRYFLVKFGQLLFPWTAPYFPDHMTLHSHFKRGGRGIVLTAGDDQAPFLLTTIPTFRKLGCDLPIEIMYLGDSDLSEDYRSDLESLDGVITRDIAQMVNDEGWKLAGWAAKPFAILYSSFREVIFIDADSLFFVNPAILFEDPAYQKTGALFFRDRLIMPENKKRWLQQILPKPISRQVKQSRMWTGDSGHQQESGVIVVDKWRHYIALLFVTRMNGPDRDGNKEEGRVGVYDMVYGKSSDRNVTNLWLLLTQSL